jgi:hypothetical protein
MNKRNEMDRVFEETVGNAEIGTFNVAKNVCKSVYGFARRKKVKKVINHNDLFIDNYSKLGFKSNIENGWKFPYCLGAEESENEVIYSFKANNNNLKQFENAKDGIEAIVNIPLTEIRKNENNLGIYELVFSKPKPPANRLNIFKEMKKPIDNYDCIPLDSETVWNYRECPHSLITGVTRGGKTSFVFYLIRQFKARGADIRIIDPKKSALSYMENYIDKDCASENRDIVILMKKFVEDMNNRYREMKQHPEYRPMTDYADYGYKPKVLIFDECMSYFGGSAENDDKTACKQCLLDLIAKGREAGFYIILTTQRSDTKFIDGAIRDQLGLRVSLGSLSGDGYKMTFGETGYKLQDTTKGAGFIFLDGTGMARAKCFVSPYMPKEYNFFKDFVHLLKLEIIANKKLTLEKETDINKEITIKNKINNDETIDIKEIPLSELKKLKTIKIT